MPLSHFAELPDQASDNERGVKHCGRKKSVKAKPPCRT